MRTGASISSGILQKSSYREFRGKVNAEINQRDFHLSSGNDWEIEECFGLIGTLTCSLICRRHERQFQHKGKFLLTSMLLPPETSGDGGKIPQVF